MLAGFLQQLSVIPVPSCLSNLTSRWMDGILCILFFLALGPSPMHVYPSIRLPVFTDGTAHARLNCYGQKIPIQGPWKRIHSTTLISNVWNPVYTWNFKHMIATQLHPWKPQYFYNFRHVKSVRHLKFSPVWKQQSGCNFQAWNRCPTWNYECNVPLAGEISNVCETKCLVGHFLPSFHSLSTETSNGVDQTILVQRIICCLWAFSVVVEHFGFWRQWSNGCLLVKP